MDSPAILGLATAVNSKCYSQKEIFEILRPFLSQNPTTEKIFENAGIGYRYLTVSGDFYQQERTTQERNELYMREAVPLAELAVRRCLQNAGRSVEELTDLIVVSCTGIDTPGLDLHLAGKVGMPPYLHRTCILGMGCYGAFPGLLRAREAAISKPGRLAMMVTVEICSLHFQPYDQSIENVVSSALFADGAAAVLVGSTEEEAVGPRLIDAVTFSDYQTFDHMAFHLTNHGFRMSLSAYVPRLLAANVEGFVDALLQRNALTRNAVRFWGVHPGSSKILDHVQQRIGLTDEQMEPSRRVLYHFGNMSSTTVLFVLEEIQRQGRPSRGDYGVLMSFGPGLTMEAALVQW